MKKVAMFLGLLLGFAGLGVLLWGLVLRDRMAEQGVFYLAVAGPMSGSDAVSGQMMRKGIQLYLDQKNASGGVNGQRIVLRAYNDLDQRQQAIKAASDIAADNKILGVIGHLSSSASLGAGDIYKQSGIPAITPTATSEDITRSNEWYFRVIPNNQVIAQLAAMYLSLLGEYTVSLIVDRDPYGLSLAEGFRRAASDKRIAIEHTWSFDASAPDIDAQLQQIIADLRATQSSGMLFFATYAQEAVKIIASLKYPGTQYRILGPESFESQEMVDLFKQYPLERSNPGYYSDGIYALSPFMPQMAGETGRAFHHAFLKAYDEEPSNTAALSYDAARMLVKAIERTEIHPGDNIRDARRQIRKELANFDNEERGLNGVYAPLYFDSQGDVNAPLALGIWQKQTFIPAFSQYRTAPREAQELRTIEQPDSSLAAAQNLITTKVVYAGLDINELRDLDFKTGIYLADFYLWFRFEGDFEDTRLEFVNAVEPIDLGTPILQERDKDIITHTYRVKGRFQSPLNFRAYPFDRQTLSIQFIYPALDAAKLVYVPDLLGMPEMLGKNIGKETIHAVTGWTIENIDAYQDLFKQQRTGADAGNALAYSRFNANIVIAKEGLDVIVKAFFPFAPLILVIYCTYYIPAHHPTAKLIVLLGVFSAHIGYYWLFTVKLPQENLIILDQAFQMIYGAVGIAALWVFISYLADKQPNRTLLQIAAGSGKVLYPGIVAAAVFWMIYQYRMAY